LKAVIAANTLMPDDRRGGCDKLGPHRLYWLRPGRNRTVAPARAGVSPGSILSGSASSAAPFAGSVL